METATYAFTPREFERLFAMRLAVRNRFYSDYGTTCQRSLGGADGPFCSQPATVLIYTQQHTHYRACAAHAPLFTRFNS
jgi:hypothetical protein